MKQQLRMIFSFILNPFESGNDPYLYKQSHRQILVAVGSLFSLLAAIVFWFLLTTAVENAIGYLLPVVVFGVVGLVCLVVGLLGNDRAIAKIWGSRPGDR